MICDVFGSWLATFSGDDMTMMRHENRIFYFVFELVFVFVFTSALNMSGYVLQLAHSLIYDHGSYSSGNYPEMSA